MQCKAAKLTPSDDVKEATGQKCEMEEKEDEAKLIDWDSIRLYIPLLSKEDCRAEPTDKAATEHHTADSKYCPHPKGHKHNSHVVRLALSVL